MLLISLLYRCCLGNKLCNGYIPTCRDSLAHWCCNEREKNLQLPLCPGIIGEWIATVASFPGHSQISFCSCGETRSCGENSIGFSPQLRDKSWKQPRDEAILLQSYFSWKGQSDSHLNLLAANLVAVSIWLIISYYWYWIGFFVKI